MEPRDLYYTLRGFANRERLRMLQILAQAPELTVSDLTSAVRLSQPLVSWHLARLRRARLVNTDKRGGQVFCSLNRERVRELQAALEAFAMPPAFGQPGAAPASLASRS